MNSFKTHLLATPRIETTRRQSFPHQMSSKLTMAFKFSHFFRPTFYFRLDFCPLSDSKCEDIIVRKAQFAQKYLCVLCSGSAGSEKAVC